MLKRFQFIITILLIPLAVAAQEVAVVVNAPANVSFTKITDGVLDYGNVLANEGPIQITLTDSRTEVIRLQGFWFRNVNVTITAPPNLQLDPSNTIPYTLGAAYANQCEENKNQATPFPGGNTASFRMMAAGAGSIFGCGNRLWYAEAYIYIYGDINVGNVNAGDYSGVINIYVEYD